MKYKTNSEKKWKKKADTEQSENTDKVDNTQSVSDDLFEEKIRPQVVVKILDDAKKKLSEWDLHWAISDVISYLDNKTDVKLFGGYQNYWMSSAKIVNYNEWINRYIGSK